MNKYLTPQTTQHLRQAVFEMNGMIDFAKNIADKSVSESIIEKIEKQIIQLESRYAEIHNGDGSVLVKHPGIGFITMEEKICEEPTRLFAAKTKSLSSVMVTLYGADAHVAADGNVTYINRKVLLQVEMTPMAYASLLASPGRGCFPATIRQNHGEPVFFDSDLNEVRGKLMFEKTQNATEEIGKWAIKLVEAAQAAKEKGGIMSKGARESIVKEAKVMKDWGNSNPGYYAKLLADFTAETTTDMKMEITNATKIMERK